MRAWWRRRGDAAASGAHAVVVGGGIAGLVTALLLAEKDLTVTVVERDDVDAGATADEAFLDERPGVPQSHQTHGFLARLLLVLRARLPEVLADLEHAGGTTVSLVSGLGPSRPGDDDLEVLVVRRSTFESVLRRRVDRDRRITVRRGIVDGLLRADSDIDGIPTVSGVRLADASTIDGDLVVACPGARTDVAGWLGPLGVDCPEQVFPSNLVYLTRWYRGIAPDRTWEPRLLDHLPYLKVLGVPGDGGMLSVTLAVPADDGELRRALGDDERFDRACAVVPALAQFFGPGAPVLEPVGPVRPMAGLLNRSRRFVDGTGRPSVVGFHAVGDAHTTTNPIFGRGATMATLGAVMLADAHEARPADPVGRAVAYEAACRSAVHPWFANSVLMEQLEAGVEPDAAEWGAEVDAARFVGALFVLGADDPDLGRALARYVNLVRTPRQLMADDDLMTRVMTLAAEPGAFDGPVGAGPDRDELLRVVGSAGDPVTPDDPDGATASAEAGPVWPADGHPRVEEHEVEVEGGTLWAVTAGPADGPPVVLVHGFPELAYSWRHQIDALAAAGCRVVAYDQRGCGSSLRPADVGAYGLLRLVDDLRAVLDHVGVGPAVLVGHDWGVPVVDAFARQHPSAARGVVAMSLRPVGRQEVDQLRWFDDLFGDGFNYVRWFQQVDVPERELEQDPAASMSSLLSSPDAGVDAPPPGPGDGLLAHLPSPTGRPVWMTDASFAHYVDAYARSGFTGSLNWYRNLEANWADTAHLEGARITAPSAFIAGSDDGAVHFFPAEAMADHLVDLRFEAVVDGAGHWVQQERPDEVNDLLLRFVREISGGAPDRP